MPDTIQVYTQCSVPARPRADGGRGSPDVPDWPTIPALGDTRNADTLGSTGSGRFRRVFDLESILEQRPPRAGATKVIGVDGHGGSGKTTLAAYLSKRLGAEIVHTDDFASWDNPKDGGPSSSSASLNPCGRGLEP